MSAMASSWSIIGLWLAVVASGLFHGINPGMGWPLAVSAGLMERRDGAIWSALSSLAAGHLLAMVIVILPFAVLTTLLTWQREIQLAAGVIVLGFGGLLLVFPRHPRMLVRIKPTQLGFWSFAVAIAHGAALMLIPVYLGLCQTSGADAGHEAAGLLIGANLGMAVLVSVVHTLAMACAGGISAYLVYRFLGLKFLSTGWLNLEVVWPLSLCVVGSLSLVLNASMGR